MDLRPEGPTIRAATWLFVILAGLATGFAVRRVIRKPPPPPPAENSRLLKAPPAATAQAPGSKGSQASQAPPDSLSMLIPEPRPAAPPPHGGAPAGAAAASDARAFDESEAGDQDADFGARRPRSGRGSYPQEGPQAPPGMTAASPDGSTSSAAPSGQPAARAALASAAGAPGGGGHPGGPRQRAFDSRTSRRTAEGPDPTGRHPFEAAMGALPPGAPVGDAVLGARHDAPGMPREPAAPPQETAPPDGGETRPDATGGFSPAIDPRFGEEAPGPTPPKLYRIGGKGAQNWSDARPLKATVDDLKSRLKLNGSYRMEIQGETSWSQWKNRDAALDHIEWRLKTRYVGDVLEVGTADPMGNPGRTWLVRIVRKDPKPAKPDPAKTPPIKPADTVGNNKIDALHAAVWQAFPDLESWGICNCRRISGSSRWSQHAWCNAEDLHRDVKGKTDKASMDPVAHWLYSNRGRFDIQYIIWRRDPKCDNPTNDHCNHIHVDMKPSGAGRPPCAR